MYLTWHCPQAAGNPAGTPVHDIAKILSGEQSWGPYGSWFWKSEPIDGYYCLSQRDDLLRKHAIQLRDAGMAFVYFDSSNHPSTNGSYADRPAAMIMEPLEAVLRVWSTIPGAPRIVPFVPVTSAPDPMVDWMMAKLGEHPQMQLIVDGKPFFLLVSNPTLPVDESAIGCFGRAIFLPQDVASREPGLHAGLMVVFQFLPQSAVQFEPRQCRLRSTGDAKQRTRAHLHLAGNQRLHFQRTERGYTAL
jgi:hypothetical protein